MTKPHDGALGACPFCHRYIEVDWSAGMLFHALPECERFKTLTADQFVQAVIDGEHKN